MTEYKRKLIEVALPLDEINAACKADKNRKVGTIRNIHKWFAPMPLPAWRALLFAALVDAPEDEYERAGLLELVRRLVANGADLPDQHAVQEAGKVLQRQFPSGVPAVMDPFCGGGSTLVEAQRLGLVSVGSDLNPVPALISRTLTEVLPKVIDGSPVLKTQDDSQLFCESPTHGYLGLIQDVRIMAERIEQRAHSRLADRFPKSGSDQVVSWLWVRTAACPNPACRIDTILTTSWWLSKKRGEPVWIEPSVANGRVTLRIESNPDGEAQAAPKVGDGVFECVNCSSILDGKYLRAEGSAGRLGIRLAAVLEERTAGGKRRRVFREPTTADVTAADQPAPNGLHHIRINPKGQGVRVTNYGMEEWIDISTPRQLAVLEAFSAEVASVASEILGEGGSEDWARAVATLLGLAVGKLAHYETTQTRIEHGHGGSNRTHPAFGRNDLPMTWDFVEVNPFAARTGWAQLVQTILQAVEVAPRGRGVVTLADARSVTPERPVLIATDPPYFDAIGYADHSDFFYPWHRRALADAHPDLYRTIAAPKSGDLTAIASHHDNNAEAARDYFIEGFTTTFQHLAQMSAADLPMIVVYASKEKKGAKDERTRWSSILTAMLAADLEITGAWPIHGTGGTRLISQGTNAVATYVAMVARPRGIDATTCSLGEFNRVLRRELPAAVQALQAASIIPVDMAQAVMGPGMSIFSRYIAVIDQEGRSLGVDDALQLINGVYDEVQEEQEGYLDPDSQFAVAWWHKHGWGTGTFGEADALARPKGISVDDVARAGVVVQQPNKVTAVGNADLDPSWDPMSDIWPTSWEAVHHLVDRLVDGGGQTEAARLLAKLAQAGLADSARLLTYRLAGIAASTKRTKDEERYNALIEAWPRLVSNAPTEGLF